MEVKKLHASSETAQQPSSTPNVKDAECPADTDSLTSTAESFNIPQTTDAMDISQDLLKIDDPVLFEHIDDIYLKSETSSDGSKRSPNSQSEISSTTSSLSSPSSLSVSSIVELLETSQIPSPDEALNEWLDREETNQLINKLMTGYHYLQPFTKSLTDEELEGIFTHGVVSKDELGSILCRINSGLQRDGMCSTINHV
jgi:hypothetical protein